MQMPTFERIRIAQDLHDGIAQDLVGIGYSLDLMLSDESLSNGARAQIRRTRLSIDTLIAKVRQEILNLRRNDGPSLAHKIREIATELCSHLHLELTLEETVLPSEDEHQITAIVTEILRNCLAHSRATRIGINLYSVNNRICLEVWDDGIGGANVKEGHFGMLGITERVHNLGGSITLESIDGTRIAILI